MLVCWKDFWKETVDAKKAEMKENLVMEAEWNEMQLTNGGRAQNEDDRRVFFRLISFWIGFCELKANLYIWDWKALNVPMKFIFAWIISTVSHLHNGKNQKVIESAGSGLRSSLNGVIFLFISLVVEK